VFDRIMQITAVDCDQMTGTFVDECRLTREIGPELKYILVNDNLEICGAMLPGAWSWLACRG